MDLASLFGELRTDIFGVFDHVFGQLSQHGGAKIRVLHVLGRRCARLRLRRLVADAGVDVGRRRYLDDVVVAAQRAGDSAASKLVLVIGARGKPSLETMIVSANQIKNFHVGSSRDGQAMVTPIAREPLLRPVVLKLDG